MKKMNSKFRILYVATKLFGEKGFDGVSVREICREAEVNLCMVSYHFGGKRELYQAILDEIIKKQTRFASSFVDMNMDFSDKTKDELIEILLTVTDKVTDFFYTNVQKELMLFLFREQQFGNAKVNPPLLKFVHRLIAAILDADENSEEVIFKTLSIISQIGAPKFLPRFSLSLIGQDDFTQKEIKIIKENVKTCVEALLCSKK